MPTDANSCKESKVSSLQPSEKVQEDLYYLLQRNLEQITKQYASYVSCICSSLEDKGITAKKLTSYLLKLRSLKYGRGEQHLKLLAGLRNELKKAETIHDIVDLIDELLFWTMTFSKRLLTSTNFVAMKSPAIQSILKSMLRSINCQNLLQLIQR